MLLRVQPGCVFLTGQNLSAKDAKEYGAVNEIVPRKDLLTRAWELAQQLTRQNPLTLRYSRMTLTQRFRRRLQEGLSYGLALAGISAMNLARQKTK